MTKVLVRIAKLVDDDVWANPEAVGAGRELFWSGALKLKSERIQDGKPVPVRINHVKDGTRDIGRVTALSNVNDRDGRWVIAHCDVDKVPGWLRRGTPASMSWCNLGSRTPMPGGWTRHNGGMVTEVSLLSPGRQAYEPGAKVWHIVKDEPTSSPTARGRATDPTSDRPLEPTGEVIHTDDSPLIWRNHPNPETAEIHRRMDFVEQITGKPADPEAVIVAMQIEREGTFALERIARERQMARQYQPRAS